MKLETVRTIARKARRDLERPGDVKRRIAIGALSSVAVAALTAARSGETGQAWVVQPGREPLAYEFRGVPGPR